LEASKYGTITSHIGCYFLTLFASSVSENGEDLLPFFLSVSDQKCKIKGVSKKGINDFLEEKLFLFFALLVRQKEL